MPAQPTVNGNPFVQPVSFGYPLPEWTLNPMPARHVIGSVSVGDLVQVRADNTAVLADSSSEIEANAVVAEINTSNKFWWTTKMSFWMTVADDAWTGDQPLWLGEDGAVTPVEPTSGLIQRVGFTAWYRASDDKHLVQFDVRPSPKGEVIPNDSGGATVQGYIYGRDSDETLQVAISGSAGIPPRFVALQSVASGANVPIKRGGQARVVAEVGGAYVVNGPAYLSATTAGNVTRVRPSGLHWQIGTFAETARDGNNTILVDLNIDTNGRQ